MLQLCNIHMQIYAVGNITAVHSLNFSAVMQKAFLWIKFFLILCVSVFWKGYVPCGC